MSSTHSSSQSAFDKALDRFRSESGLTVNEIKQMKMVTLGELQNTLATIQQDQRLQRKTRHLQRLQPFLDVMQQYSATVDIFAQTSDILAFIWGPMKFIISIASNFVTALDAVLDGYRDIAERMPQLARYQATFSQFPFMQTAVGTVYEDIMMFHLEAVKLFKQKSWRQMFHATWRNLRRRIDEVCASMTRHSELLDKEISFAQLEELQAGRAQAETLLNESRAAQRDRRAQAETLLIESRAAERDRRRMSTLQWLGLQLDTDGRHEKAKSDRLSNTGLWILHEPRFQAWFAPDCKDPLLWIHGMPGAGKTILASLVIEEAKKLTGVTVLYFYCRFSDSEKGDLAIAKSFLSQLMMNNDSYLDYLYVESLKSRKAVLSSIDDAVSLLQVGLKNVSKTYIVLDGLDEYPRAERKSIIERYHTLITKLPINEMGIIRCLFVSQNDGAARKDLSGVSDIEMTFDRTRQDIDSFCVEQQALIEKKFGVLRKPELDIRRRIGAQSQGMFLFAKLVTENLYQQVTLADLEREMSEDCFPKGINAAYDRIMCRVLGPDVPEARRKHIRRLLGWLICARRPLRWFEVQCAVSLDLHSGQMLPSLRFVDDAKDLCQSLVTISSDQTVTLVHSTLKAYLLLDSDSDGQTKNVTLYQFQRHEVEYDLALLSLMYLSLAEFDPHPSNDSSSIRQALLLSSYSFAEYASCFWAAHLETAFPEHAKLSESQTEDLIECLQSFMEQQYTESDEHVDIPHTIFKRMGVLRGKEYYDETCKALAVSRYLLRPSTKHTSGHDVLRLPSFLVRMRSILEDIIEGNTLTTGERSRLENDYGSYLYKCSRMHCIYYYQGFKDKKQRDDHIAKHDRSFICDRDGCLFSFIGFDTKEKLNKHRLDVHGIIDDEDGPEFPPFEVIHKQRGEYQCKQCRKSYKLQHNLEAHARVHDPSRKFTCTICGMTFDGQYERKRHEASQHSEEKRFTCGTNDWGCKKKFTRKDALQYHWKSDAGRRCEAQRVEYENARGPSNSQDPAALPMASDSHEPVIPSVARISSLLNPEPDQTQ